MPSETQKKNKLVPYLYVTKPRSVVLLVFTAAAAGLVAVVRHHPPGVKLGWSLLAVTLGVMGVNAITCYIDRDIDAAMKRTKNRPLPTGAINPPQKVLFYGLALLTTSIVLAYLLHPLAALWMVLGATDSAFVYNRLSKRKTCLNIILGAPAGGMPLLATWAALRGQVELLPLLMALLIVIWTPTHIWSLAIYYKEDYDQAAIPMLPNVFNEKRAIQLVAVASLLLIVATLELKYLGNFGSLYTTVAILLALTLGFFAVKSIFKPSRQAMWQLFKLTSPYLFLIFLVMVLDSLFKL